MRIEEVYDALDRAKHHVRDAATVDTMADMRIQLKHARAACKGALAGLETLIKGAQGEPTILPRAPRG